MCISHEAIHQALFVQGRGALRRALTACLRIGRGLRLPSARARGRGKGFASSGIMITQRPEVILSTKAKECRQNEQLCNHPAIAVEAQAVLQNIQ